MPIADEIRRKIDEEPDFINLKRFDFSLEKAMEHYPDGAPPKVVAQALGMSESEVESTYQSVVERLRRAMKVE